MGISFLNLYVQNTYLFIVQTFEFARKFLHLFFEILFFDKSISDFVDNTEIVGTDVLIETATLMVDLIYLGAVLY